MIFGLDSSTPSANPNGLIALGYNFVCGYLPAMPGQATPHVWTPDEWKRQHDATMLLMPIFVAPYGIPSYQQGVDAGNFALQQMQNYKLSDIFCLDVENGYIASDYIKGVCDAAHAGSCMVNLYGSASTIQGVSKELGAWVWDKTWLCNPVQSGNKVGPAMPDWDMWQYAFGPQYDYDVATDTMEFATLNV